MSNIVGTVSATNAGNGWWRVSVSGTSGAFATALCMVASNNGGSFLGTTGSGIFVWGAQAEAASFATSYIPTVASTVTRNADVATMTGTNFSNWYNQPEGTLIVEADTVQAASNRIVEMSAGTGARVVDLLAVTSSGANVQMFNGTANLSTLNAFALNMPFKTAGAYKTADYAVGLNGGALATNNAALVNTANALYIGRFNTGANYLNGHIRTIAYFNTRLPNAQLQTLTAPSLATTLSLDFTSGSYNVGF